MQNMSRQIITVTQCSFSSFFLFLNIIFEYFIVPSGKFGSPYLGKVEQPQKQHYPLLLVCALFSCVQTMVWLPVLGIFEVVTDVDVLEADSGRKISQHTRDSNPCQTATWLFSQTFYQLSYRHPIWYHSVFKEDWEKI